MSVTAEVESENVLETLSSNWKEAMDKSLRQEIARASHSNWSNLKKEAVIVSSDPYDDDMDNIETPENLVIEPAYHVAMDISYSYESGHDVEDLHVVEETVEGGKNALPVLGPGQQYEFTSPAVFAEAIRMVYIDGPLGFGWTPTAQESDYWDVLRDAINRSMAKIGIEDRVKKLLMEEGGYTGTLGSYGPEYGAVTFESGVEVPVDTQSAGFSDEGFDPYLAMYNVYETVSNIVDAYVQAVSQAQSQSQGDEDQAPHLG